MHVTLGGTALVVLLLASSPGSAAAKKPQPGPDNGPSLAATMQFIQDKMNNQGDVLYVQTVNNNSNITIQNDYHMSDVVADAAACSSRTIETIRTDQTVPQGTIACDRNGHMISADDLHNQTQVSITTFSFKDVENLTVDGAEIKQNRGNVKGMTSSSSFTDTPAVFAPTLNARKPAFSIHTTNAVGNQSPVGHDVTASSNVYIFRDEELANRVAKAMQHAVELCGGGNKDPF